MTKSKEMNIKNNQNAIAAGDLNICLTEQPETVLIDLLSQEHFAGRHIPGAQNACVFLISFLDDMATIFPDKQTQIIVYGASLSSRDADGQYTVDADASQLEWTGRNPNTHHFGTVDISKGMIDMAQPQVTI